MDEPGWQTLGVGGALLARYQGDLQSLVEQLATFLEGTLPRQTEVRRTLGVLGPKHTTGLTVRYGARELAMTRMEEEADLLGADGIVGVRVEFKGYAFEENILEFQAIGTAVRHEEGEHYRTHDNRPFTSDLSGQDSGNWSRVAIGPSASQWVLACTTSAIWACCKHSRRWAATPSSPSIGGDV